MKPVISLGLLGVSFVIADISFVADFIFYTICMGIRVEEAGEFRDFYASSLPSVPDHLIFFE